MTGAGISGGDRSRNGWFGSQTESLTCDDDGLLIADVTSCIVVSVD
jgi:hypothetical protein